MRTLYALAALLLAAIPAHAQYENFNNPALESKMAGAMMLPTVIVDMPNTIGSGTVIFSEYAELPSICTAEARAMPIDPLCAGPTNGQKQIRTYVLTAWHVLEGSFFPPKKKEKDEKKSGLLIHPMKTDGPPTPAPPSSGSPPQTLGPLASEKPTMVTVPPHIEIVARAASSTGEMDIDFVRHEAAMVAYDAEHDLALLRLTDGAVLPYVAAVAPRNVQLQPFRKVWAVGAPLGFGPEVTEGNLSGAHERLGKQEFLLSSATIYKGNSGGGLFQWSRERTRFELIGVNNAIGGGIPHIVLSVPIVYIHDFLKEHGFDVIIQ